MIRLVAPSILILFSALGVVGFGKLEGRLADIDRRPAVHPAAVSELATELDGLSTELHQLACKLATSRERELTSAVLRLEEGIGHARAQLEQADVRIEVLEASKRRVDPVTMEQRIADLTQRLDQSQRELALFQERESRMDSESREHIEALQSTFEDRLADLVVERNTGRMWNELLAPSVQILGDTTVGSGVLLHSQPRGTRAPSTSEAGNTGEAGEDREEGEYRTYVLTAWHVVRDVYGGAAASFHPVPVKIYDEQGDFDTYDADLVISNAEIDVALLELQSSSFRTEGVALAPRGDLSGVSVFDPIYAVGCPLGNDPIPTSGEIASTSHEIDGVEYWMISAPTYIGNSGGGIFDAETHELLGIFSKIYTHGSMRSTIVPHMGLATPVARVYDWLDESGFASLLGGEPASLALEGSAETLAGDRGAALEEAGSAER